MSLCNSSEIPVEASQAPRDIGSIPTRSMVLRAAARKNVRDPGGAPQLVKMQKQ